MRKSFVWIATAVFLLVSASSLLATPMPCVDCDNQVTWTGVYDPADILLDSCGQTRRIEIPLSLVGAGFQPGVDTLYKYQISVYLYDDADANGYGEAGWLEIPGHDQLVLFSNLNPASTTLKSDWVTLQYLKDDGAMSLIIKAMCGDFFFDKAVITANGCDNGPAPVPEPATMFLLGSGLAGLAGFGRKKFKKA